MNKGIRKAEQRNKKEREKQADIIYSACFTVLHSYGWDADEIITVLNGIPKVLHESHEKELSVFEMLEQETGIELSLDGVKSYHKYAWMSSDTTVNPISDLQYIYMLNNELKWIPSIILAALVLTLRRDKDWDDEKLSDFIQELNRVRMSLGEDTQKYREYMAKKTGYKIENVWRD